MSSLAYLEMLTKVVIKSPKNQKSGEILSLLVPRESSRHTLMVISYPKNAQPILPHFLLKPDSLYFTPTYFFLLSFNLLELEVHQMVSKRRLPSWPKLPQTPKHI